LPFGYNLEQTFQEENRAMPGPPKQFDRDEALSRAIEVFWEQGYLGTSIEDLLEAMELSRSSMYSTFGDKKALFLEALQVWIDEEIAQFLRPPWRAHPRLDVRRRRAGQGAPERDGRARTGGFLDHPEPRSAAPRPRQTRFVRSDCPVPLAGHRLGRLHGELRAHEP
jgi:AcrR family transcriptional regulator